MKFNPLALLGLRPKEAQAPRAPRVEPGFADNRPDLTAATALPTVAMPVGAGKKAVAQPSYRTQAAKSNAALSKTDRRLANTDITTYRTGRDTSEIVRNMAVASPDMAATINAYLRVGIPEEYTIIARNMDGSINPESTATAGELVRRMMFLGDPTLGYNPVTDQQSLSESLGKELLQYGGMGCELVLDKQLVPSYINPVSITKLQWWEEEGGVYPVQVVAGQEYKLDIPTFFYISVDQDLLTAYASSYLEAAIQAAIADSQFMNDLRKAMGRALQPRMTAKILTENLIKSFPLEIRNDEELQAATISKLVEDLAAQLEGLEPEDALVSTDMVEFNSIAAGGDKGNSGEALKAVQQLITEKFTAGLKSVPAVLGRDGGSSSSTTSAMLFMKNADMLRRKLNVMYSRVFTQAMRILGNDVYVEFKYRPIDLRPTRELEAYAAMEQSRITEQWSLGLISDEAASIALTGNLPPAGFKPLAGTMFKTKSAASENPDSQTSTMQNGSKDPLKPSTPAQPKS